MEPIILNNDQRLEDCIEVLQAGKNRKLGNLAAMIACKAIIDRALVEHEEWKETNSQKELSEAVRFKARRRSESGLDERNLQMRSKDDYSS